MISGLDVKGLQTSRTLCSFLATMEVIYLVTFGVSLRSNFLVFSVCFSAICLFAKLMHNATHLRMDFSVSQGWIFLKRSGGVSKVSPLLGEFKPLL